MTEQEDDNWVHFSAKQPSKRKRAELVCVFCHLKKVKCDLKTRSNEGKDNCTNCDNSKQECRIRTSKRGKQRHIATDNVVDEQQDPVIPPPDLEATALRSSTSIPLNQTESGFSRADEPQFGNFDTNSTILGVDFASQQAGPSIRLRTESIISQPFRPSPSEATGHSHSGDVDTGYLQVYDPENQHDAERQELDANMNLNDGLSDPMREELQQTFAETYWEYCYCWCPVLDQDTLSSEMQTSPLLANAIALAASHIQPPLIPHEGPAAYYDKARTCFYNDEEVDGLTALKALSLFYWWAPRPPSTAHRHSSWWWSSVIIRHAQQMNIHREPAEGHPLRGRLNLGLRRRIWWTAFSRERLTALCQSKPCIIDPDDCNIGEPQLSDFPIDAISQRRGLIFIHWTRLCAIIGRVAKSLSRSSSSMFRTDLHQELVEWIQSLPPELRLHIGSARTESFDRDVHQLHLPYLTTIIILHLKRSAHDLPQALPPAILAASCIARILRDILSRGNARFLMAITCWYSGTAFIALLQAARIQEFKKEADEGIEVLIRTVEQLQKMWASANVIRQGFDRLMKTSSSVVLPHVGPSLGVPKATGTANSAPDITDTEDFDWTALFPFVTRSTNRIAECLLTNKAHGTVTRGLPSPDNMLFYETMLNQYNGFLEPFTDYDLDFTDLTFEV